MGLMNVHFPDTMHLSDILLQILFYATPIIYPASKLADVPSLAIFVTCNPLAAMADMIRLPILKAEIPPLETYLIAGSTAVVLCGMAIYALSRLERRLIFQL